MTPIKKYTYFAVAVIIVAAGAAFFLHHFSGTSKANREATSTPAAVLNITAPSVNMATVTPAEVQRAMQVTSHASSSTAPIPTVTLIVGSTTYGIYVSDNATVVEAMRSAASSTSFTYSGRVYPSLGFFVDSIEGVKGGNGSYWALYIDGKYSELGASSATVKRGDTIEWRYEKE